MYLVSKDKSECCGCSACQQVCHKKAIKMCADSEGFLYPEKDVSLCDNCGMCEKVCCFVKPIYNTKEKPSVYAAYIKNEDERKKSSSGALFYVIAKAVIERGGIVYGAVLDENMQAKHIGVDTLEALESLRGSKYVQTNQDNVYIEVRNNLKNGRLVYFTGTPCQIAGLKSFLRKSYPNLITSDLICHGVPSQKLFDLHIKYLSNKYGGNIVDYKFRDNSGWCGCEIVTYYKNNVLKKKILPTYELSPYLYSFMYGLANRYSCYKCPFATIPRQGDITLADFWGVKKFFPNLDVSKGCSLVIVNNMIGCDIWRIVRPEIYYFESDIASASENNLNLQYHSMQPSLRVGIYECINLYGYKKIAETIFRSPVFYRIYTVTLVKNILGNKNILRIKRLFHRL